MTKQTAAVTPEDVRAIIHDALDDYFAQRQAAPREQQFTMRTVRLTANSRFVFRFPYIPDRLIVFSFSGQTLWSGWGDVQLPAKGTEAGLDVYEHQARSSGQFVFDFPGRGNAFTVANAGTADAYVTVIALTGLEGTIRV